METNTLLTTLAEAKHRYDAAVARGMGVAGERERLMNTLFNSYADIVTKLGEIQGLHDQIDFLNKALDDADAELAAARKTTAKAKPAQAAKPAKED